MPSRKDPKVLPKVLARNRTQRSYAGVARRKAMKRPNVVRSKRTTKVESRKVPRKATAKGQFYKCGKIGHVSKDCRSKEAKAFEAGDELAQMG